MALHLDVLCSPILSHPFSLSHRKKTKTIHLNICFVALVYSKVQIEIKYRISSSWVLLWLFEAFTMTVNQKLFVCLCLNQCDSFYPCIIRIVNKSIPSLLTSDNQSHTDCTFFTFELLKQLKSKMQLMQLAGVMKSTAVQIAPNFTFKLF